MNELELLTKDFLIVRTNEIKISSTIYPVIGTEGLGPCISFILHSKEKQVSIVGHLSKEMFLTEESLLNIIKTIYTLIKENNIINNNFDLYLIEGAMPGINNIYLNDYDLLKSTNTLPHSPLEVLEILIKNLKVINIDKTIKPSLDSYQFVDFDRNITDISNPECSKRFAFDSKSGKFVTNKVLFGVDYLDTKKIKK